MDRRQTLISFYDSFSALAQFMWNHREENPEINALCQRAVDSGKNCLYAKVSELMNLRNYPLPNNWTLPAFCDEIIDTESLPILSNAIRDVYVNGITSDFHLQAVAVLTNITGGGGF